MSALRIPAIETPAEAETAALRHLVDDAHAHGLCDYPAKLAILDGLAHPEQRQARRLALHELVRWHADWSNDGASGVHEVALLRRRLAPSCTDDLWTSLCAEWRAVDEGAPKTGRDWWFSARARDNVDVLLDEATALPGDGTKVQCPTCGRSGCGGC